MMKTIGNAAEPSQTQPLAILATRSRSCANLSYEVSPPESPNPLAKFRQTTTMGAYGRHQAFPQWRQPAPTRPPRAQQHQTAPHNPP